jgi:hypothetical protein
VRSGRGGWSPSAFGWCWTPGARPKLILLDAVKGGGAWLDWMPR